MTDVAKNVAELDLSRTRYRIALARDTSTPMETLLYIFTNNPSVKEKIALLDNRSFPEELKESLIHDSSLNVRTKVANTTKNSALLEKLVEDSDPRVVSAVAWNPSASSDLLDRLVKAENCELKTRRGVAQNDNTRVETLTFLLATATEHSTLEAMFNSQLKRIPMTEQELNSYPNIVRETLAGNTISGRVITPYLDILIHDENWIVRAGAAGHHHASNYVMDYVANHEMHETVVAQLASNPRVTVSHLNLIVSRFPNSQKIAGNVAENKRVTADLAMKIWFALSEEGKRSMLETSLHTEEMLTVALNTESDKQLAESAAFYIQNPVSSGSRWRRRTFTDTEREKATRKSETVALLQKFYPDVDETMPQEWVNELATGTFSNLTQSEWNIAVNGT